MAVPTMEAWSVAEGSTQYKVYLGLWTNWSRGSVLGKTLTISRQNGDLLIAFTAFFVAFVGSRFWRIACLGLHRLQSSNKPMNAVYHQRQILLRNDTSAEAGLLDLAQLFWAWRHSVHLLLHILPALLIAIFCVATFTVASGFSSQISSSAGTEVLLDGANCGQVIDNASSWDESIITYDTQLAKNALNYVQQCYSNSRGLMDCNAFTAERIPTFADPSAPCPFNNSICRNQSANLILDTGYLDSHYHLGVNAPSHERILFRRVLHCAPLETAGLTTPYVDELGNNYTLYNYGPSVLGSQVNLSYTHKVKSIESQYDKAPGEGKAGNYILTPYCARVRNETVQAEISLFAPNPILFRDDADLSLLFLSGNGVVFLEQMDDAWYRATHPAWDVAFAGHDTISYTKTYRPTEAASPLACTEQFQYCFATPATCGPLASSNDALVGALELSGINKDSAYNWNGFSSPPEIRANPNSSRLAWFSSILGNSVMDFFTLVDVIDVESLKSIQVLQAGLQLPLPINQWQTDITHVWATSQAYMQALFVEVARGQSGPELKDHILPPSDHIQQQMCNNQKIRSTGYASFNFFALLFTYTTGLVIIIVSFALAPMLEFLQRKWDYKTYAQLEWATNATLQLHRLAHDATYDKTLTWSHCVNDIPTTIPGVNLAGLDVSNPRHPILKTQPGGKLPAFTESSDEPGDEEQSHKASDNSRPGGSEEGKEAKQPPLGT